MTYYEKIDLALFIIYMSLGHGHDMKSTKSKVTDDVWLPALSMGMNGIFGREYCGEA